MKNIFPTIFLISFAFISCSNFPSNIKEREYSGVVINKFRSWNHDHPYITVKTKTKTDTVISVWSYSNNDVVLYDAIHVGDSVSKKKGNYSINVWHTGVGKIKYELHYKGEWYYDGHE